MSYLDEELTDYTGTSTITFSNNRALDVRFNPPKRRIRWKPRYEEERQRRIRAEQRFVVAWYTGAVCAIMVGVYIAWGC